MQDHPVQLDSLELRAKEVPMAKAATKVAATIVRHRAQRPVIEAAIRRWASTLLGCADDSVEVDCILHCLLPYIRMPFSICFLFVFVQQNLEREKSVFYRKQYWGQVHQQNGECFQSIPVGAIIKGSRTFASQKAFHGPLTLYPPLFIIHDRHGSPHSEGQFSEHNPMFRMTQMFLLCWKNSPNSCANIPSSSAK